MVHSGIAVDGGVTVREARHGPTAMWSQLIGADPMPMMKRVLRAANIDP